MMFFSGSEGVPVAIPALSFGRLLGLLPHRTGFYLCAPVVSFAVLYGCHFPRQKAGQSASGKAERSVIQ